jgi:RNA polymerase sigma factor (sigma-70 family)
MGGAGNGFPSTRHSAVLAAASTDESVRVRAFGSLVACYWKPAYKYVRVKWRASNEEAKDLVQGFFAKAMEKRIFERFDPGKAKFRTYLKTCLDGYVINERKAGGRQKRGGGKLHFSFDFADAEREFQLAGALSDDPDAYFQREWVRSLFSLAVLAVREQCSVADRRVHFQLFESYDLRESSGGKDRPTYASLGEQFGLSVTQVTNYLSVVRRDFRAILLGKLREMTSSEEEFQVEAKALLGDAL